MQTTSFLILALSFSAVLSACTGPNFISTAFNFNVLTASNQVQADSSFKRCSLPSGTNVCCTATTINSFQDMAEEYIETLEELAGDRDQYFIDRRNDLLLFKDSLNKIRDIVERTIKHKGASALIIQNIAGSFKDLATTFTTNFETLRRNFTEYQKARVGCMETLVQTQAALWCLACSYNFDTDPAMDHSQGSEAIAYSDELIDRIHSACFPYIQYSAGQSAIIRLYIARSAIDFLAAGLESYIIGDELGAAQGFDSAVRALALVENPTEDLEKPVGIPNGCNITACDWYTNNVFVNGVLRNITIVLGGSMSNLPTMSADMGSAGSFGGMIGGRILQSGWAPAVNLAGVNISFQENPGNVDNGAIRNGVVGCVIAAFLLFI